MKNSILILSTIVALFSISCKKEDGVKPVIKPVTTDSLVRTKFLTSGIIPTTVGADSMTDVLLKIRISVTAGDSDLYLKRSVGIFGTDLRVESRNTYAPYSAPVATLGVESNLVMMLTGSLRLEAGQTAVVIFLVSVHTRVRNGEYQLQLFNLPCSIGQDDGLFETNVALGAEYITEWVPA